jgi:hypothetical protein
MFPVKITRMDAHEMSQVFARLATGGDVVYNGNVKLNDVYCKIDVDEEGMSTYFHYWLYHNGVMSKAGSGGYIAMLHTKPQEIVLELPLRANFARKEVAPAFLPEHKKLPALEDVAKDIDDGIV